ncbi:VanZ family protein [Candidatus Collierbacteria bacterium]|nr:VanZ family protein [Candidatus Collierbacteria bacterium]
MKNFINRYYPVMAWAGLIFFFSSLQTPPSPPDTILNFVLKKSAHIFEYAVLYWLTSRAVNFARSCDVPIKSGEANKRHMGFNYFGPFIFVLIYAIFDEIHQSFVPNRHAKIYDVGFDSIGALLVIFRLYRHRNSRQ